MTSRRIEYVHIDDLRENPANPKLHAGADIGTSIKRFGYVEPVIVDERTGMLVAGHGRKEALLELETKAREAKARGERVDLPDGIRVKGGSWQVPVVRGWSSANDAEASAMLIASNRLTEKGGWNDAALADIFRDLAAQPAPDVPDFDAFAGLGYDAAEVQLILDGIDAPTSGNGHGGGGGGPRTSVWEPAPPVPRAQRVTVEVLAGDSLDVLKDIPDDSIDAVVTDPPYNLSSGKNVEQCLRRVLTEAAFPKDQQRLAPLGEERDLPRPRNSVVTLAGVDGPVGVEDGVGVPERAVHLKGAPVVEPEVDDGGIPAERVADADLPLVGDAEPIEFLGDFVLEPADAPHAPFCDGTCSCFTEPGPGVIAVLVALPGASSGDLAGGLLRRRAGSDSDVRDGDDAGSEPSDASRVVADGGAIVRAVLRLDLRSRTGELRPAHRADQREPLFTLSATSDVRTRAGAGGLAADAEASFVRLVDGSADGALAVRVLWHAIRSSRIVGGFMGKTWDGWESPASFQRWVAAWAVELYRVMKPGAHALLFGGTRTYHRLAAGIEDAGFTVRDSLHWIYASGFPKSLDISKAIDDKAGATRPVVGHKDSGLDKGTGSTVDFSGSTGRDGTGLIPITNPATAAAAAWNGWGTALKPSHEPIVLARKPLEGSTVDTVLKYGTGGLNIDGARVGTGRWPANIVFAHAPGCSEEGCIDGCPAAELDAQSGSLPEDDEEGASRFFASFAYGDDDAGMPIFFYIPKASTAERNAGLDGLEARLVADYLEEGDKALSYPKTVGGPNPQPNFHPTVKPVALMRWLVRLVAAPGATVLDPFAGSGSTLVAAVLEGRNAIGCEKTADYLPILEARIAWAQGVADTVTNGKIETTP